MDEDDIVGPRRGGPRRSSPSSPGARQGGGRCPACDAPAEHRFRPFCSKRCQDADLGRWLRGAYRFPTEEEAAEGGPGAAPGDDPGDDGEPGLGGG